MAEKLKVLILNGSPRTEKNTRSRSTRWNMFFEENGVEYETIQVGKMDIRGCAACEHVIKTESVCLMIS